MAYNTEELYNQALENDIKIVDLSYAEHFFNHKLRFKNEDQFILDLIPKLESIINQAYNEEVKSITRESSYHMKDCGYFNLRADIVVKCKSDKVFIIECKNPTHQKAEILNSMGQMIGYQLLFDNMKIEPTIILASSLFTFYMAEIIKKHNIECDLILNNKLGTAFMYKKDL